MKKFNYTIQGKAGIHARPAGVLVKKASSFASTITLEKDGVVVDLTKLIALMQLDVQCNEVVTITVDGTDEDVAAASMHFLPWHIFDSISNNFNFAHFLKPP